MRSPRATGLGQEAPLVVGEGSDEKGRTGTVFNHSQDPGISGTGPPIPSGPLRNPWDNTDRLQMTKGKAGLGQIVCHAHTTCGHRGLWLHLLHL